MHLGQFPRVSGAWLRSDGSFEYQFLIDNTVYWYFKFTLSAMSENVDNSAMPVTVTVTGKYW